MRSRRGSVTQPSSFPFEYAHWGVASRRASGGSGVAAACTVAGGSLIGLGSFRRRYAYRGVASRQASGGSGVAVAGAVAGSSPIALGSFRREYASRGTVGVALSHLKARTHAQSLTHAHASSPAQCSSRPESPTQCRAESKTRQNFLGVQAHRCRKIVASRRSSTQFHTFGAIHIPTASSFDDSSTLSESSRS